MVVPVSGSGASHFDSFVDSAITVPLGQSVSLTSPGAVRAALHHARVRLRASMQPQDLISAAQRAHATLLLVVVFDHKKLRATLLDVQHGTTLTTVALRLRSSHPGADAGQKVVSAVQKALPHEPPAEEAPAEASAAAPAEPSKMAAASDVAASQPPPPEAPPSETPEESVETEATPPPEHPPSWRPSLRLGLGLLMMQRTASLSATNLDLPCYCGSNRDTNPLFAGVTLSGEYFPLAWNGKGEDLIEGLGVFFEGGGTRVSSYVSDSGQLATSTVLDLRGGAAFRYVWWNSAIAPDVTANLGYSYFSFPLPGSSFPSVSYSSFYMGAHVNVPLGTEQVVLVVGGGYMPLFPGASKSTVLGTPDGGNAFEARAGVRVSWDMFEVAAMYRYWIYNARYSSASVEVAGVPTQANVALADNLNQFSLTVGLRF